MPESVFQATDEVFQAEMPGRLEEREEMIRRVMQTLSNCGCHLDEYLDRLCIDEAIANAILHGNEGDSRKSIRVRVFCCEERWGVEITDEGPGFDWEALLERIRQGVDQSDSSGRGLALILASGKHVEFHDGGRRLLMTCERKT